MGLEAETIHLREAIERLEVLCEFVARQVQRPIEVKSEKRLHPPANILDAAMTRHRELRDPFDLGRAAIVGALEDVGHIVGGTIKRNRPYVVADFETREPVSSRASKRRLEQLRSETGIRISEMPTGPGVHLVHRGQPAIQHSRLPTEDRGDRLGCCAGPSMIVQIGLGNSADSFEVFCFQSLLKFVVHDGFLDRRAAIVVARR